MRILKLSFIIIIMFSLTSCFSDSDTEMTRKKLGLYVDKKVNLGPKRRPVGNIPYEGKSDEIKKLESDVYKSLNNEFDDTQNIQNLSIIDENNNLDESMIPIENPAFAKENPDIIETETPSFWSRIKNFFNKEEQIKNNNDQTLQPNDTILHNNNSSITSEDVNDLNNNKYPKLGHVGKRPKAYSTQDDVNKILNEASEDTDFTTEDNTDNNTGNTIIYQQPEPLNEDIDHNVNLNKKSIDAYDLWYENDQEEKKYNHDLPIYRQESKSTDNTISDQSSENNYDHDDNFDLMNMDSSSEDDNLHFKEDENILDNNQASQDEIVEENMYKFEQPKRQKLRILKPSRYAK